MRTSVSYLALWISFAIVSYAQSTSANSGTVRGSVLDPSGAAIPGATVQIQNPVSGYNKSVQTDPQGNFQLNNIPFNSYHLSASAPGFQGAEQDLNVRSQVPVEVKIAVQLGAANESVSVTESGDLVQTDPTSHTDMDRDLIEKLPLRAHLLP